MPAPLTREPAGRSVCSKRAGSDGDGLMTNRQSSVDSRPSGRTMTVEARAIRRVRRRLIPFLALLYFVAYLDRVNVGFAALQMNTALGFSSSVYGKGAGIFFIGYFLF